MLGVTLSWDGLCVLQSDLYVAVPDTKYAWRCWQNNHGEAITTLRSVGLCYE